MANSPISANLSPVDQNLPQARCSAPWVRNAFRAVASRLCMNLFASSPPSPANSPIPVPTESQKFGSADLMKGAFDIFNRSAHQQVPRLALAVSRNSDLAQQNKLSLLYRQLHSASSFNELLDAQGLRLIIIDSMPPMLRMTNRVCYDLIPHKLLYPGDTALTQTEQAERMQNLRRAADVSVVLLEPIRNQGALYKLNHATLENLIKLFSLLPDARSQILKTACQAALVKHCIIDRVMRNGTALQYASEDLKSNKDIVLIAVQSNGLALSFASENLQNDKQVVLPAVQRYGLALEYASDDLKSDKEVVLAAVQGYGQALEFASFDLKNDKDVVLAAVKQKGRSLSYASDALRNEPEVVLAAVREAGQALYYASDYMKCNKEVLLAAVKQDGWALCFASEVLKNDRKVVLAAVQKYGKSLNYASDDLKSDKRIVLAAVKQDGEALQYASEALKIDPEVVRASVQQSGSL
jgi:hypothetical protein